VHLEKLAPWRDFCEAVHQARPDPAAIRLIQAAGLSVDLSTQRHSPAFEASSRDLLEAAGFERARAQLFDGQSINRSEQRAALHTALRGSHAPRSVAQTVASSLARMGEFVEQTNAANRYQNIVHLGIGGSDWGPRMVWQALRGVGTRREWRFAANIDAHAITNALEGLDAKDTLLVIASKSFTTIESITNAQFALDWMRRGGVSDPLAHTVALTANPQAAQSFGVAPERTFAFWDWVGGRYSVWSSIGLTIALGLGWQTFLAMLAGARAMDEHFLTTSPETNAPIQMALSTVANTSVLGFHSEVICPYDARLTDFVPWLQQLQMESLGKGVTQAGEPLGVNVSPATWGMPGTDSQHTFFQWLHQGQEGAPVDFIACLEPDHPSANHHRQLFTNCLAQRAALWQGKTKKQAFDTLVAKGMPLEQANALANHCVHPGLRPSTLIVLQTLDAHRLGALLALYEHKVFTAAVLWGINPFDQWGVEFGKTLARQLTAKGQSDFSQFDASTQFWMSALNEQRDEPLI
jgi:glucose-6-phosphate isomerase